MIENVVQRCYWIVCSRSYKRMIFKEANYKGMICKESIYKESIHKEATYKEANYRITCKMSMNQRRNSLISWSSIERLSNRSCPSKTPKWTSRTWRLRCRLAYTNWTNTIRTWRTSTRRWTSRSNNKMSLYWITYFMS